MNILIVHPERAMLERLGRALRNSGIYSVRTCHLVAAVVYIRQLAPEVIVAGGHDTERAAGYAELIARCQGRTLAELHPWGDNDLALLHHRTVGKQELRLICQAIYEVIMDDKTKKAAPLPPLSRTY